MPTPSQSLGRRKFLARGGGTAAVIAALAFVGRRMSRAGIFGAPRPDPDGILDLPEGFAYALLEQWGDEMDDGYRVPGRADGMGCFRGADGTLILMRNHENSPLHVGLGPYKLGQLPPPEAYTRAGMGGVTRLVVHAQTFERISSNLVLVGTSRNCAGGVSPWGWLSCEETIDANHGYVFLCDPEADAVQPPRRVDVYGRFNHEAACVDPTTHIAYLTEDREDGCLYRFVPGDPDEAPMGVGVFQALKVVDEDRFATTQMKVGELRQVEWVEVANPTPDQDSVRRDAQAEGAAIFVRGEGISYFEGAVYLCSTSGGPVAGGQIFRLIDGSDDQTGLGLELMARSDDRATLDMPDNITISPSGRVWMAEDGEGGQHIRYLDDKGEICEFARNALDESEFAGLCFSPDGKAMFVNIQEPGLTLVITGPFAEAEAGIHTPA